MLRSKKLEITKVFFCDLAVEAIDFNGYDEIGASELDEIGEKVRHYVVDIMSEKKVLTVPS